MTVTVNIDSSDAINCAVSTGNGFEKMSLDLAYADPDATWAKPLWDKNITSSQFVDHNGDGNADLCFINTSDNKIYCGQSDGRKLTTTVYSKSLTNLGAQQSRQWTDINTDGKADFCRLVNNIPTCTLSNGSGFESSEYTTEGSVALEQGEINGMAWVDANGDAKPDLCRLSTPNGSGLRRPLCTNSNKLVPDVVTTITDSIGESLDISYGYLSENRPSWDEFYVPGSTNTETENPENVFAEGNLDF